MKRMLLSVLLVLSMVVPVLAQDVPMKMLGNEAAEGILPTGDLPFAIRPMTTVTFDWVNWLDPYLYWPDMEVHTQAWYPMYGYGGVEAVAEIQGCSRHKTRITITDKWGNLLINEVYGPYQNDTCDAVYLWRFFYELDYTWLPGVYTVKVTRSGGGFSKPQATKVRITY